jgi:excisionase family DNA binding protein
MLKMLTVVQVAEMLGVSTKHVRRLTAGVCGDGRFPASVRVGNRSVRWVESAVVAWITSQSGGAA